MITWTDLDRMEPNGPWLPKDRRPAAPRCVGLEKSGRGPQGSRKGIGRDRGIAYACMAVR